MEYCIGARNFAAMAVSSCATWSTPRRTLRAKQFVVSHSCSSYKVRASSQAGSESCVVVEEDFADKEDYLKAGGSQLLFVQMQQNKSMDEQSKLSDKLLPVSVDDGILDLVVIGCGPAGLALAAESAKLGLNVGLIGPDLPFTNNYGVWEDEFKGLGLERCIEHVWRDTIVYLDDDDPILIGRPYGRVSRHLLHEELLRRCVESGVSYLSSKVESITESSTGHRLVACEHGIVVPCRLATVASGAASGKLLEYEVGGPRVSVQTAYGVEVEVENNPYDPSLMVFMDYRDFKQEVPCLEAEYPTFLYAMPVSSTRVFFEETCLASKDGIPFDVLKKKLMARLEKMGIRVLKTYEEEWSYIPVGGSLPNTEQRNLAFGAAASMVHPATGYSVVRSLSEAPSYASAIANILRRGHSKGWLTHGSNDENISMQGIGLNVSNEEPTTCLNAALRKLCDSAYQYRREDILAAFFNKFEIFYDLFVNQGFQTLEDLYYQTWLHSGQRVIVQEKNGDQIVENVVTIQLKDEIRTSHGFHSNEAGIFTENANPILEATGKEIWPSLHQNRSLKPPPLPMEGLTSSGYLLAIADDHQLCELHPDGNSLDFFKGLIRRKLQ